MPLKPCNFFNKPGGCRRGNECTFSHTRARQSDSPASMARPSSPSTSRSRQAALTGTAPAGICNFYWSTGRCNREFSCRFRHIVKGSEAPLSTTTMPSVDSIAPFLTEAGLAKVNNTGTDIFFVNSASPRSPSDVHNHMQRFLHDDFRFRSVSQVYAILTLISSANSSNSLWTSEDGQLFLSTITKGNALLRIDDIIRWSPITNRADFSGAALSFQRGYLPLLRLLSSEFVVKSTLNHLVNALYMRIMDNFEHFAKNVEECMQQAMDARSFKDFGATVQGEIFGSQVIASLGGVFFECLTRFKNAVAIYPALAPLIRNLHIWMDTWAQGISSTPPSFNDPLAKANPAVQNHIVLHLRSKIDRLVAIVDREQARIDRSRRQDNPALLLGDTGSNEAVISALHSTYEGPGNIRQRGQRHDNDHVDIEQIRIAPTHEELVSRIPPYLPANIYGAPHHLPASSMERLLDIQFRLLREELTAPLRKSIQLIEEDMRAPVRKTQLAGIVENRGGKYRGYADNQDGIIFNVYTNVAFQSLYPDRHGLSVGVSFDTPPGRARSGQASARAAFWEGTSGKRLMQGGLIALIQKRGFDVDVHLGTLASSVRDLANSAKISNKRISAKITFFDSTVEFHALHDLRQPNAHRTRTGVLVEAPVMFEAIRPFLEALRVEPESVPFGRYLVHQPPGFFDSFEIDPPRYAVVPGFTYQLASLFPPEAGVEDLKMSISNAASVNAARQSLKSSRLDPSQADSIVDALTREVSMIQGPPGTGKSYIGVELLRVLLQNDIEPVLMIAFTNHALDHLLSSVLDAQITSSIVRLGSRSSDERISNFSLETMELAAGQSRLGRAFGNYHRELKAVEGKIESLMKSLVRNSIVSHQIIQYLEIAYPEHHRFFLRPPRWITVIFAAWDDEDNDGWQHIGRRGGVEIRDNSMYAYWKTGQDLEFLRLREQPSTSIEPTPPAVPEISCHNKFAPLPVDSEPEEVDDASTSASETSESDLYETEELWQRYWLTDIVETVSEKPTTSPTESISFPSSPSSTAAGLQISDLRNPLDFFAAYGLDEIPSIPSSDRPLEILLSLDEIWSLSLSERERLDACWVEEVREKSHRDQLQEFERLREEHRNIRRKYNESKDEARRQLLKNVKIVGCTTTGAAKLTSLLKGLAPRVMLVEEAGQVLEAHVLGSLVPSVEHLILIGDHLQLRPTLNNYSLSMDNKRGSQLYKFDMSLMERLTVAGLPMSRIEVQRRMRPAISKLIRNTLYPYLEDHQLVKSYPSVRGFRKNLFFFSHNHRENEGADDPVSKFNMFEVKMIKDLVLYLLRQGCYSQEGDIVILCAYLGQLARVRDALAGEVAVVIDDRDQADLADQEEDDEDDKHNLVEHVKVSTKVRIRTVDNYQGEEAKIVILSLVRNHGPRNELNDSHLIGLRGTIGFLKAPNRTNVAISRAREGLFILGNASQFASRSHMWRCVVEDLEKDDAIGNAFPISCDRHPDAVEHVSEPGQLPRFAPDGGCLKPCDFRLKCGHVCPHKCHPDDPKHIAVTCFQPCRRLCPRMHPCNKQCADDCGKCHFQLSDVELPCGHICASVPCYKMDDLVEVFCTNILTKRLPNCEHSAEMKCSEDPANHRCGSPCGGIMACCGRDCKSRCSQCQDRNARDDIDLQEPQQLTRVNHMEHPCEKELYCAHRCLNACSQNHECVSICKEQCRQQCSHARCNQYCSTPCSPCKEPCTWKCPHHSCPVPCGSVCARLPCDERCDKSLQCGHSCPSVCGEDCTIQICPTCAPQEKQEEVVDLILHRTLDDIVPDEHTLDELLITIPGCKHVFTVETLDGHCGMTEYYRREGIDGKWLALKTPDDTSMTRKPPVCPTCRSAITSPRYGRVFKSADLEILERNVISRMSQSLRRVQELLGGISTDNIKKLLTSEAQTISVPSYSIPKKLRKSVQRARAEVVKEQQEVPADSYVIDPGNRKLFTVSDPVSVVWKNKTRQLTQIYAEASKIARTRSAHSSAWEAAFSYLYEREMDDAMSDPSHAPRRPKEHALRSARMKVGQPQPRGDKRFLVEAFWVTLRVRFVLAELAQVWLKAASSKGKAYPVQERQMWGSFVLFLLDTCSRDAQTAFSIAEDSEARRQMTTTMLLIMRADLERFRFNVEMARQSDILKHCRADLMTAASRGADTAEETILSTEQSHLAVLPNDKREWLTENYTSIARSIVDEWRNIEKSIRSDSYYAPISLDEKMSIVKALNFSHTGHYYNCPNGHTFVIEDCGGASQRSTCPECGAVIGGANHVLEASNTRAMDLEDLAREQGAHRSPWAWGV